VIGLRDRLQHQGLDEAGVRSSIAAQPHCSAVVDAFVFHVNIGARAMEIVVEVVQ
jgi:hypothetical protein